MQGVIGIIVLIGSSVHIHESIKLLEIPVGGLPMLSDIEHKNLSGSLLRDKTGKEPLKGEILLKYRLTKGSVP